VCGIVGYVGKNPAKEILLDGLTKLEYRGYDSAGIALRNKDAEPVIIKAVGILKNLIDKVNAQGELAATSGIAHTRWATHVSQSEVNAHPHSSSVNLILGVHNGIIQNFHELKEKLLHNG
jgi:glucosamine--fructose-6-phosphate aminotransferase (isomerizing)